VDNALHSETTVAYEEQLAHERDRLRTLLEVNNAVVGCLETRELFQAISASLRRTFGLDYASLLIYDPEAGALRLHVLDFPDGTGAIREDALVPLDSTPAGQVFRARQGRVFSLEEARAISASTGDLFEREGIQSLCSVPLISRGTAWVPECRLAPPRSSRVTTSDSSPRVAGQVAIALDNASPTSASKRSKSGGEKVYLEDEIRTDNRFEEIVGQSRALKAPSSSWKTVAPTDSTVLIYGETGTGKELLARAIHDSARANRPPSSSSLRRDSYRLLESELFGHEKGAFTGAIAQRIGRFELAHRGTIFLDEVGEIPIELQSKLLRVLQEREFERLGSSRTIRTDARLVAATNRDLAQLVEQRQFRADLYYRLNVFPMTAPPLRERRDDIPLLVRYFVQQYARRMNRRITSIPGESMNALVRYHWPGNIRELQKRTTLQAKMRKLGIDTKSAG
jgi:formate hydrogenlyase transcriptional activator